MLKKLNNNLDFKKQEKMNGHAHLNFSLKITCKNVI